MQAGGEHGVRRDALETVILGVAIETVESAERVMQGTLQQVASLHVHLIVVSTTMEKEFTVIEQQELV